MVIGVCGCGVRACRSSGGVRVVGPVCSSHDCWPVAVLSSRLVVTDPLLLCRCSTVGLLGSGSLVHRSSCHWSVTALLLLCLIAHRCSAACLSPVRRSSAVRSSLVRLLLCRCSVCLAVAFLSLVCHWSVRSSHGHWFVARPWLARGWPVCSSFCLLVPGLSVAGFSVRVMVTGAVTTLSAHTLLICGSSLVHLFGSGSLAHRLVYLLGSWPLVLHSSVCLSITALSARVVVVGPSARVVVAGPSARVVVAGPAAGQGRWSGSLVRVAGQGRWSGSLVRVADRASLVRLFLFLLVRCCSAARYSSICSGHGRSSVYLTRGH